MTGQRVGIVALPRVQHPGDPPDVAQIQFVVFVLGAARGEDDGISGQRLGKIGVVTAALGAAVAAGHDYEFPDGAGLHGIYDLIRQGQDLIVGKAADDLAGFKPDGRRTAFGMFDQLGKILLLPDSARDMLTAWIARRPGGVPGVPGSSPSGERYSWWSSGWGR